MVISLVKGQRYRATIQLFGMEAFAGNATLASMIEEQGFVDVEVTGEDGIRVAVGTWDRESRHEALDEHIAKVEAV